MKAGYRRVILLTLIVILALSTAGVAFAEGPPDPNMDVCDGELPPFGTANASCQWRLDDVAPNGPWGPLGP